MIEALTALLLADAPLSALVGTRVHWGRLPDVETGRPYVNLTLVSDPDVYHMKGASAYRETLLQADVWAETAASRLAVVDALRALLTGYRGTHAGVKFSGIFLVASRDLSGPDAGNVTDLFRQSIDFQIHWSKET